MLRSILKMLRNAGPNSPGDRFKGQFGADQLFIKSGPFRHHERTMHHNAGLVFYFACQVFVASGVMSPCKLVKPGVVVHSAFIMR